MSVYRKNMAGSKTLREFLIEDLTEIANGNFLPKEWKEDDRRYPMHRRSYLYGKKHPLHTNSHIMTTALASLLLQTGLTLAHNHCPKEVIENLDQKSSVRLLSREFMIVHYPQLERPRARIDILTRAQEDGDAVFKATPEQIERAADAGLNAHKLSS